MFVLRKVGAMYKVYYGSVKMDGAVVVMDEVEDFMGTKVECEKYITNAVKMDAQVA